MEIHLDNYLLCSANLALGRVGPSGLTLNGESIVDEWTFFGAALKTFYDRGGASVILQFRVTRLFGTLRLAQKFALTHRSVLAGQGQIKVVAGEGVDTEDIYLEDAVVQPAIVACVGRTVTVQYTIKGGAFTTDVPDDLPEEPDTEDDFTVRRRGSIQLTGGDLTKTVTFSTPLTGAPTVVKAWITGEDGAEDIDAKPIKSSYATTGFDCYFTGAIPDSTYYLEYIVIE